VDFEWDPTKAETSFRKHGVAFLKAIEVFQDPFRQDQPDTLNDYGEDRWITLGRVEDAVLHVVSTRRGESIRLISAR
jgi:uncharacterized protein